MVLFLSLCDSEGLERPSEIQVGPDGEVKRALKRHKTETRPTEDGRGLNVKCMSRGPRGKAGCQAIRFTSDGFLPTEVDLNGELVVKLLVNKHRSTTICNAWYPINPQVPIISTSNVFKVCFLCDPFANIFLRARKQREKTHVIPLQQRWN